MFARKFRRVACVAATCGALVFQAAPAIGLVNGSLSGRVTNSAAQPLARICVFVHPATERHSSYFVETDSEGRYQVALPAGDYKVRFDECFSYYYEAEPRNYLPEWYDDKLDFDSADRVAVNDLAETSGVDAVLARAGSISGTVATETGQPPGGLCIFASSDTPAGYSSGSARTQPDGSYRIRGLLAGSHRVLFSDCEASPRRYVTEWYDNAPGFASSTPVEVLAETDTPDIDAILALGGRITGRVTDEHGEGVGAICVSASPVQGEVGGSTLSGAAGTYVIGGLRTGDYRVFFIDCYRDPALFESEWYEDAADSESARRVKVHQPHDTESIDAVLTQLPFVDVAITSLKAAAAPIATDVAPPAPSPWVRRITVQVSNLGEVTVSRALTLLACPVTTDLCWTVANDWLTAPVGQTLERVYDWNALGTVGDVTIRAYLCPSDHNFANNSASIHDYVGAGGTGIGFGVFSLQQYDPSYCFDTDP